MSVSNLSYSPCRSKKILNWQTQNLLKIKLLVFWKKPTLGNLLKNFKKESKRMLVQVELKFQEVKNKDLPLPEPLLKILTFWFWMKLLQLWIEKIKRKFKLHYKTLRNKTSQLLLLHIDFQQLKMLIRSPFSVKVKL